MTRTTEESNLDEIAGIIAEHLLYDYDPYTEADAARQNARGGWSFAVRYDWESYADGWFTRVEGVQLSDDGLRQAWDLALAYAERANA